MSKIKIGQSQSINKVIYFLIKNCTYTHFGCHYTKILQIGKNVTKDNDTIFTPLCKVNMSAYLLRKNPKKSLLKEKCKKIPNDRRKLSKENTKST